MSREKKFDLIRVGTSKYTYQNGKSTRTDPKFEGYQNILVLPGGNYNNLSPYVVKNDQGYIMENYYQSQKVYAKIPAYVDRNWHTGKVTWEQKEEIHCIPEIIDGKEVYTPKGLTSDWYAWNQRLSEHSNWVRYPLGRKNMQSQNGQAPKYVCLGSFYPGLDRFLGYTEARIYVYLKNYAEGVRKQKKYCELLEKVKKGEKF